MKNLFVLILFVFLSACNKENSPQPETLPVNWYYSGGESLEDGTMMNCELFNEMYFSHQLDFQAATQNPQGSIMHGSVTFNPDGTCTNHLPVDDRFVSWSYLVLPDGSKACNVINVKMKDGGEPMLSIGAGIFDNYAFGAMWGDGWGEGYYFYPL